MKRQWVFVRGIMSESYHWSDFISKLQGLFPQDDFHTADIAGNGRLNQHLTPLSIEENVHLLRSQVPPHGRKILVGFSLGGMLAHEWAHHHPEDIHSLILINSSFSNSPFYKRMTAKAFIKILTLGLKRKIYQQEETILKMTTSLLSSQEIFELAKERHERNKEYPVKPLNFAWQLGVAARISQKKTPPAPTLLLSSAKDRVVHPQCSQKIAETWTLPLNVHPHAGHDLTLDDPNWVIEHIHRFIFSESDK